MKYNVSKREYKEILAELNETNLKGIIGSSLYGFQLSLSDLIGFNIDNKSIKYIYTVNRLYTHIVNSSIIDKVIKLDRINKKYNLLGYNGIVYLIYEICNNININILGFNNNMKNYASSIRIPKNIYKMSLTKLNGENKPKEIILPDNIILYVRSDDYSKVKLKNIGHVSKIFNPEAGDIFVDKSIVFDRLEMVQYNLRKLIGGESIEFTESCNVETLIIKQDNLRKLKLNHKIKDLTIRDTYRTIVVHTKNGVKIYRADDEEKINIFTPLENININIV